MYASFGGAKPPLSRLNRKKKKMCLIRILRTLREWSRRLRRLRACLHGGGGPQVDEVTGLGGVARLSI